jgi:uncharacterized protein (DUF885 family)
MLSTLSRDPQTISKAKLPYLYKWSKDQLTDHSLATREKNYRLRSKNLDFISGYRDHRLNSKNKLSKHLIQWHLEMEQKCAEFEYYNNPINPYSGIHLNIADYLDAYHYIEKRTDIKAYNERLRQIRGLFEQVISQSEAAGVLGIIPSQTLLERAANQMASFIAEPPDKNYLYVSLIQKIENQKELNTSRKLTGQTLEIIENEVYPAYRRLLDYTQYLRTKSTNETGAWAYPNGKQYYLHRLEKESSMAIDPDSIYELALKELLRVKGELVNGMKRIGIDADNRNVIQKLKQMARDPDKIIGYSIEGRRRYLQAYDSLINLADAQINNLFYTKPRAQLEINKVPAYKEKNATVAYYEISTLDGGRPANIFVRTDMLDHFPDFYIPTLAYHEGLPGHHFQIAGQLENKNIPIYRKRFYNNGFIEGWASYAERLMYEAGAYDNNPEGNIGRLRFELLRVVRMIAYIGIHHKKWSRQDAALFLSINTDLSDSEIQADIDRYLSDPGQVCTYHLGMMKFLELREIYKKNKGDEYDIRDFHELVLSNGILPFHLLENLIMEEIKAGK